ncbi:M20 metallopeptidase family protein [Nocardiopsis potens]|uniref:M20 metallopeptidase family protein n=1 Tax=Nocardiopsis potens TaxID=1246458 RepID=UPI00034C4A15|nr:M20 family metallopeptidase [Nocardiopsis potens]
MTSSAASFAASSLRASAAAIQDDLVRLRRALHREPELGLQLPLTQAKVLEALRGLPVEVTTGTSLSSVTAVLRGGRPGPAVLLRGDMDALPVHEETGLDHASRFPGRMHACGHDLHTAVLVGAVRLLAERRAELPGDVVFMFQPGEEDGGGARLMIEEGVLEAAGSRPVAAYALHVSSAGRRSGVFACRGGTAMASADRLTVEVHGRGGHGSAPHTALDPVPAACEMVTALQTMVTRRFDVFDPVVVGVGRFHAGDADNVIPDRAEFEATIRSFSPQSRERVRREAARVVRGVAEAHGLRADAEYELSYPVTVNDAAEADFAARTVREVFGADRYEEQPEPMTASEDFSFVAEQVPAAFLMLGAAPPQADPDAAPFNHSAHAVFDDAVLGDGAALLAELALRRLTADPR